jgi:hypothetical protein
MLNERPVVIESLLLSILLTAVQPALAQGRCEWIFGEQTSSVNSGHETPPRAAQLLQKTTSRPAEKWRPTDPIQFSEIITALNDTVALDSHTTVEPQKAHENWIAKGAPGFRAITFSLNLKEPFRTTQPPKVVRQSNQDFFPQQDVGGGLVFHMHSNSPQTLLRIRFKGRSNDRGIPFSATVEVPLRKGSNKLTIPWSEIRMENSLSELSIPFLDFKIEPYEMRQNDGTIYHGFKFTDYPHGQEYPISAGCAFQPALLSIDSIEFSASSERAPEKGLEIELGSKIYRDFSLRFLTENQLFMQSVLRMNFPSTDGSNFLNLINYKYQEAEAIEFALSTLKQGHEHTAAVLAKYGFQMIEIPDEKLTADDFFTNYLKDGKFIPIENGAFAKYHGRYTHAAQVLVLIYGARITTEPSFQSSPEEQQGKIANLSKLHSVILSMSPRTGPFHLWRNLWNIYFDAPGDEGPNCPLWWAKQFRAAGIE